MCDDILLACTVYSLQSTTCPFGDCRHTCPCLTAQCIYLNLAKMANSTRQLRFNGILQANLEKIINDGVRFNLEKLAKCSQNIAKYKADNHEIVLKREYMTGKLLIQRLEMNLVELQNVYQSMQNVDLDKKYEKQIILLRTEVTERIRSFKGANQTLESNNLDDSQLLNTDTPHSTNVGFQIQEDAVKLTDAREKLQKVEALKEDIQELNTLAVNLASLVGEQQQVVDNIENNVTIAADNIEDGTKSLIKASAYSIAPITCAALGGAVFGPVGAVVGLKLSTGLISALGGSAITYSFAKFLQNRKKEECANDLETISSK